MIMIIICAAAPAGAAPRLAGGGNVGAQWNTPGLLADAALRIESPLPWADDASPLFRTTRAGAGLGLRLSPAFVGVRAFVEAEPLALLVVRAGAEAMGFFGLFGNFLELSGDAADFSIEGRAARALAGDARPALAFRAFVQPSLRFRLGPIVGFADASLEHWWTDAPSHFYEPGSDVLLARTDWLVTALDGVLYEWGPARIGLVHRVAWVPRSGYASHRAGPGVIWKIADRFGPLASPTLLATVALYLQDGYKTLSLYAAAAFAFELPPIEVPVP